MSFHQDESNSSSFYILDIIFIHMGNAEYNLLKRLWHNCECVLQAANWGGTSCWIGCVSRGANTGSRLTLRDVEAICDAAIWPVKEGDVEDLSLAWRFTCFARWSLLMNRLWQTAQANFFSPVCVRLCRDNSSLREKRRLQSSYGHGNGRSPVWVRVWAFRCDDLK